MTLYVCYTTAGGDHHACAKAYRALKDAGHEPQVVRSYGARLLPEFPFNKTPGRQRAKALTGKVDVPVLELDDGTGIGGSDAIVSWAKQHPAGSSAAASP